MRFGRAQQGEQLVLGLRNLYLLPTRFGCLWLAAAGLLHVVGLQTLRNGPLLLGFVMLALWLLSMVLTPLLLMGVDIRCGSPLAGFAGERLDYPVEVRSTFERQAIHVEIEHGQRGAPRTLPAGTSTLHTPWTCRRRGFQLPGRLRLSATAPLGLFICWTRWEPPVPQLVYPARVPGPVGDLSSPSRGAGSPAGAAPTEGSDTWQDLRPHRAEDGQGRVAWKAMAQGRGRLAKVFQDDAQGTPRFSPAVGIDRERALEHLSHRICQGCQQGLRYGLMLPHGEIPPGQGRQQRDRCLEALALHP